MTPEYPASYHQTLLEDWADWEGLIIHKDRPDYDWDENYSNVE